MIAPAFLAPAVAASLSAAALWLLKRRARTLPADIPNRRSLHASPVPRAGGYAVWAGFLPAAVLFPPAFPGGLLGWLPAFLALAAVSAADDTREVRVVPRLAVHGIAALWTAAWLAFGTSSASAQDVSSLVLVAAIALALAWSANLYNFMDGNDGLAASMGVIGFGAYALAPFVSSGDSAVGLVDGMESAPTFVALVASILPFLAVNLPRASMFLGDVGAVPLGFIAAAFGVAGVIEHSWPAWFPLLVFLPFIADATLTLARRVYKQDRVWEGHRDHFYQRLHQLGAGHAGTLVVYVVAMLGAASMALACLARQPDAGWWALAAWFAVLSMLFATIDYHWRKKTNISAHSPP